jgi:hypothetical protein
MSTAGALVLAPPAVVLELKELLGAEAPFDPCRAVAYAQHWQQIAIRQQQALAQTALGLHAAAGLRLAAPPDAGPGPALGDAVLVYIPEEVPAAAFYSYAAAENTPVAWLPCQRPVHHLALAHGCGGTTARNLERWLAVPVAPGDDETGIAQAVLGIVKTAEYLGVRWRTDPAHAAAYASFLDAHYGPGHDAYRPIFPAGQSVVVATEREMEDAVFSKPPSTSCMIACQGGDDDPA